MPAGIMKGNFVPRLPILIWFLKRVIFRNSKLKMKKGYRLLFFSDCSCSSCIGIKLPYIPLAGRTVWPRCLDLWTSSFFRLNRVYLIASDTNNTRKTASENSRGFCFLILFTFYFLLTSEQIPTLIASLIPVQVFSPYSGWDFLFRSQSGLYLPA